MQLQVLRYYRNKKPYLYSFLFASLYYFLVYCLNIFLTYEKNISSQQKNIIHILAQNLIQTDKSIKNKSIYALCAIEKANKEAIALLQQELQIANNNEQKALIEYSLQYIEKNP